MPSIVQFIEAVGDFSGISVTVWLVSRYRDDVAAPSWAAASAAAIARTAMLF